jgi:MoaA/NifB/PqqE/SkfB family radical SAM enzyme
MWTKETLEWIDIELTSFCNIKCKGCFRVQSKHADKILNKTYLDFYTIKEKFKKEDFPNIKIINFCGSVDEPCSHPQFFQIIEYFADWNCHINIATNGSLRTVQWWEKLATILPTSHRVTWGIDGSDELSEVYREGSNFKKVQKNFRAFNAAGGKSVWQFIEFEHNQHQTEDAKRIAKEEGFVDFKTIISHRKDSNGITYKKVEHEENPYISCKYGNQKRIFVNHMGNVIPCCHLNSQMLEYAVTNEKKDLFEKILEENDYIKDINLSNVSLSEALNGKIFSSIINSWGSDNIIPKCWKTCKKNNIDKFIKEKL